VPFFSRLSFILIILLFTACEQNSVSTLPETNPEGSTLLIAKEDTYTVQQGSLFAVDKTNSILMNDVYPESYQLTLSSDAKHGKLSLAQDGSFNYEHNADNSLQDSFSYTLSSADQIATATVTLSIIASPKNAATANADSYSLSEGSSLKVTASEGVLSNDNHVDASLELSVIQEPKHGSLMLTENGAFSYQHDHSETTQDSFSYKLSNAQESTQATVLLNINPLDDQPIISKLELAQTHVLPPEGKTWQGEKLADYSFHFVAERDALVLVDIVSADERVAEPVLEVFVNNEKLGELSLNSAETLAATESDGPAYSQTAYWVNLDKAWLKTGLALRVRANEGQVTDFQAVNVGAATRFTMNILPFYLFGLSETDIPLNETAAPDQETQAEYYAKHPISDLKMLNHPAQKVEWPYIIVAPRQGRAAQKVTYKEEQGDGYAVMSAVLNSLHAIRNANGESSTNNQYYAPLLMAKQDASYASPGGGLGGGNVATGDHSYQGIFIHEAGHAFGMPHAASGYQNGSYPYVGGSLNGSSWAYDQNRALFLPTFLPSTAARYANCRNDRFATYARQLDSEGRCIKQDPMQSGSGDQAQEDKYTVFSDFNAAVVQRYLEGVTRLADDGSHSYSGGKVFVNDDSSMLYSRWDSLDKRFVAVERRTTDGGLYGLDAGLPETRNVPVQTIIVTASVSSLTNGVLNFEANLTQIYEPLSYTGNLMRTLDPTNAADLASIVPNTSENYWYCRHSGCDYSLKVSFTDNTEQFIVLHGGFRSWFSSDLKANVDDPRSNDSFKLWSVNVSGSKSISKIELLDTPEVYNGLPDSPRVITERNFF